MQQNRHTIGLFTLLVPVFNFIWCADNAVADSSFLTKMPLEIAIHIEHFLVEDATQQAVAQFNAKNMHHFIETAYSPLMKLKYLPIHVEVAAIKSLLPLYRTCQRLREHSNHLITHHRENVIALWKRASDIRQIPTMTLYFFLQQRDLETIKFLQSVINPDVINYGGRRMGTWITLLEEAIENYNQDQVNDLLQCGVRLNTPCTRVRGSGRCDLFPIDIAARCNDNAIVIQCIKAGADPDNRHRRRLLKEDPLLLQKHQISTSDLSDEPQQSHDLPNSTYKPFDNNFATCCNLFHTILRMPYVNLFNLGCLSLFILFFGKQWNEPQLNKQDDAVVLN